MIAERRPDATAPPPIVPVKPEDRRKWQHLLTEAITRQLTITNVDEQIDGGRYQIRYLVSSYSEPGSAYEVIVERWYQRAVGPYSDVGTRCGCKAGEHGIACTHAALAIDTANLWPAGMVIAHQLGLINPDARFEYWIGDRVRIVGSERTGVVARFSKIDNRPAYIVDDPEQRERLGMYLSYELLPAVKPAHKPKVDQSAGLAVLTGRRAS